jgi:hypothetical protein
LWRSDLHRKRGAATFYIKREEWGEYLREDDPEMNTEIRLKTNRELAVGTEKFIENLENKLNRSLRCLKWGRPKKEK